MKKERSIVICINRRYGVNADSCAGSGSVALAEKLEKLIASSKISATINRVECLGQCERGPNLRIAPGGHFFHGVTLEDLPEVIAQLERDDAVE